MQFEYLRLILAKSLCLNGERLDFMGQVPFLKKPIYNLVSKIILKTDKPLVVGI